MEPASPIHFGSSDASGNELFRLALEAAPTGMLMTDGDGRITFANTQIAALFGYTREELVGMPIERLVPERFRPQHTLFHIHYFRPARDLYGLRKDGTEFPIEMELNPLRTPQGTFVLSSIVDISERRRALEQLRQHTDALAASVRERDVLLQEVHHRVKNNLQVISSLINMQIRKGDDASRGVLIECKHRVEAIGLIHEKLYQSRDYARVPFCDYVRSLARNLVRASDAPQPSTDLEIACENISLPVDKAISCGLILNELLTNAMKHAYPAGDPGKLCVRMHRIAGDRLRLTVEDSGVGIPEPERSTASLSLQLIHTLTAQLEGTLRTEVDGGTTVSIEFPVQM